MQVFLWFGSLMGIVSFVAACCLLVRLRDLEDKVDRINAYNKGEFYGESSF